MLRHLVPCGAPRVRVRLGLGSGSGSGLGLGLGLGVGLGLGPMRRTEHGGVGSLGAAALAQVQQAGQARGVDHLVRVGVGVRVRLELG